MKLIGVTETYDPCFVDDWNKNLQPEVNIIITKDLTDEMIEKVVQNQDKIILHHTITGLGSSIYEPGVPLTSHEIQQANKLFKQGFPIAKYVLRIDPILWFIKDVHMRAIDRLLNAFLDTNKAFLDNEKVRCRIYLVDLYNHVKMRLNEAFPQLNINNYGFHAPPIVFQEWSMFFSNYAANYNFETCAELGFDRWIERVGCASYKDINLLDASLLNYNLPENKQRSNCLCLAKKQILNVKPARCPHKCIYCFWKD